MTELCSKHKTEEKNEGMRSRGRGRMRILDSLKMGAEDVRNLKEREQD